MRIASLVPSATEIVFALGLADELVGISHACDFPPEIAEKPVLTRSTKSLAGLTSRQAHRILGAAAHDGTSLAELDLEALAAAKPDLILAQGLPDVTLVSYRQADEAALRIDPEISVVPLEPTSVEGVFHAISTVGAMAEAEDAAIDLLEELRDRLGRVERRVQERREAGHRPPRVVGLEWFDPPFAAGYWVPEQVRRAGGWELLGREGERSLETTWEAVREVDPVLRVLMAGGLHGRAAGEEWARAPRPAFWRQLDAVQRGQVFVVDGMAYFGRPGPRIIDGIEMLAEIFDPDAFEEQAPLGSWTPVT